MNCPHCQQELKALSCESCGHLALPGAKFCQFCGRELPAGDIEEPKLLTCESCGHKALPPGNYCPQCGNALPAGEGEEPKLLTCESCGRTALATDSYCADCGLPLGEDHDHGDYEYDDDYDGEGAAGERVACSDGMCIGIIGPDGKCTECGKPLHSAPEGE